MEVINILIIEDEENKIDEWKVDINLHNASAESKNYPFTFSAQYAHNLVEAKEKISHFQFSVSVIDIRLNGSPDGQKHKNTEGLDVLEEITKVTTSFMVIYTAQTQEAENNINEEYKDFIEIISKTESKSVVLRKISSDHAPLVTAISNMKTQFSASMAQLFYKSIWPRWSHWIEEEQDLIQFNNKPLIRHMATHLHASFLNEVSSAHPEEYYFIPPLQEQLDTGDIFLINTEYYILITPRCDLARAENLTFQFSKLKQIKQEWDTEKAIIEDKQKGQSKKKIAQKQLHNLVNNGNKSPKLHFIPQIKMDSDSVLGPFHVEFNCMICKEANDTERESLTKQRIATLSNEFVPSLVERLGAYFSRIGTPDYSHPE